MKTGPDDRRGAVKGSRGSHGQSPFIATSGMREQVKVYVACGHTQPEICHFLKCSSATLRRHFSDELKFGKAEMLSTLGSLAFKRAIEGNDAMTKLILTTQGARHGWTTRHVVSGPGGGPIRLQNFDFSAVLEGKTSDELSVLIPALESLLAAGAEDVEGGDFGLFEPSEGEED